MSTPIEVIDTATLRLALERESKNAARIARLELGVDLARTLLTGDARQLHLRGWVGKQSASLPVAKALTSVQRARLADAILDRVERR